MERNLEHPRPWLWPVVITASAFAAALAVFADMPSPVRPVVVIWFLAVCPGMAYVQLLRLEGPATQWTLAVALSFGMSTVVGMVMVYTQWRPGYGLAGLVALTLAGVAISAWRDVRGWGGDE